MRRQSPRHACPYCLHDQHKSCSVKVHAIAHVFLKRNDRYIRYTRWAVLFTLLQPTMRRRTRRTNVRGLALIVAMACRETLTPAAADDAIAVNEREFAIPVQVAAGDPDVAEVRLYCSTDAGQDLATARTAHSRRSRTSNSPRPTIASIGSSCEPPTPRPRVVELEDPELKVVVDTTPPQLDLQVDLRPTGECIVAWKIGDVAADPETLKLQYRAAGETVWSDVVAIRTQDARRRRRSRGYARMASADGMLDSSRSASKRPTWRETKRPKKSDSAKNRWPRSPRPLAVDSDDFRAVDDSAAPMPAAPRDPSLPLYVNSLSFELDYDVDRVPAASIEKVELWGTRDDGVQLGQARRRRRSPQPVHRERRTRRDATDFAIVVEAAGGASGRAPREGEIARDSRHRRSHARRRPA